jgi:hypothetical protein
MGAAGCDALFRCAEWDIECWDPRIASMTKPSHQGDLGRRSTEPGRKLMPT